MTSADYSPMMKKTVRTLWKELKKKKNVIGYSGKLMPKIRNGVTTQTLAFRVYVSKKEDLSTLAEKDIIPKTLNLGENNVPTDVIEIGVVRALDQKDRIRPVQPGISAMGVWSGSTACTLGNLAKNKKKGEQEFTGFIANNHCAADMNKAAKGTAYIQPSPYDGGSNPADKIGGLWRFVKLEFEEFNCPYRRFLYKLLKPFLREPINKVDIAFIKQEGCSALDEIFQIGRVYGKRRPTLYENVQKTGRTTGYTTDGEVIDLDWNGVVRYGRGQIFFTDCVLIHKKDFSAGGDSSSPIVSMEERPKSLAQLFAGSESHTIGCYIDNIESELEVEIYPWK